MSDRFDLARVIDMWIPHYDAAQYRDSLKASDAILAAGYRNVDAMFSEEAIERAAEALWMHRPMERISGGEPKPFRDLKPYQRLRYLGMARAVAAALRGEA